MSSTTNNKGKHGQVAKALTPCPEKQSLVPFTAKKIAGAEMRVGLSPTLVDKFFFCSLLFSVFCNLPSFYLSRLVLREVEDMY